MFKTCCRFFAHDGRGEDEEDHHDADEDWGRESWGYVTLHEGKRGHFMDITMIPRLKYQRFSCIKKRGKRFINSTRIDNWIMIMMINWFSFKFVMFKINQVSLLLMSGGLSHICNHDHLHHGSPWGYELRNAYGWQSDSCMRIGMMI